MRGGFISEREALRRLVKIGYELRVELVFDGFVMNYLGARLGRLAGFGEEIATVR